MIEDKTLEILKNFTILYVEDDEYTLKTVEKILSKYLKKVYLAKDGVEGIKIFKEKLPDIVLSDVQMPNKNGIQLAKEIKKESPYHQIAFLTAFNEIEYLKESVNMGISKYILKPIDEDKFFSSLIDMARILQNDIDRKKLEYLMSVQSKLASMGEMIENIAHQWRQPLSIITTSASGLKLQKEAGILNDELFLNEIESIENAANYLTKTIETFRDFLEDNKIFTKVILQNLLKQVLKIVNPIFKDLQIRIYHNIDEIDDIEIKLISNEITQVFINIFNNVRDAISEKNIKDPFIKINISKKEKNVLITIEDNAGGIPIPAIDRVFEPYFTTKHKSSEVGLGLYICYKIIVDSHQGKIYVENTGIGTKFFIELPLEKS